MAGFNGELLSLMINVAQKKQTSACLKGKQEMFEKHRRIDRNLFFKEKGERISMHSYE